MSDWRTDTKPKRVTYRITVTMPGNTTKPSAKKIMERILSTEGVMFDPFVQVMQVDDLSNEVK